MAVYLKPDKIETWNGVKVNKYFLTEHNDYKIDLPVSKLLSVSAVTIHNTDMIKVNGVTTPAEQYTRATKNGNMGGVIVHFYVDHKGAWWNMPLDMVTWHSGDGINGRTGNNTSISIECIMDSSNESYNQASMDNAAKLAAYLLDKYNLKVESGLVTHTYWLNKMKDKTGDKNTLCTVPPSPEYDYNKKKWIYYKTCPLYIIKGKGWSYFEKITTNYYNALQSKKTKEIYRIRKAWSDSKTQIGAFSNLNSAKEMADYNKGYKVFNNKGQIIYTPKEYYSKYVLSKTDKVYKDEIYGVITKGKEVKALVGTERTDNNGVVWIKILYNSKTMWVMLDSLKKI